MTTLFLAYIIARWDTRNRLPNELFLGTVIMDFFTVLFLGLKFMGAE